MPRPIITNLLETLCINVEVSRKLFLLYKEDMGQYDPSAFLGKTVYGIKSKKNFASKFFME